MWIKMRWTPEQVQYLYNNYKSLTNVEIANFLGRSGASVGAKVAKLKLFKGKGARGRNQKPPGEVTLNFLFNRYKHSAKRKNRDFLISKDEFANYIKQNCHYCGIEPRKYSVYEVKDQWASQESIDRSYVDYNGLDRIDSNIGYSTNNILPCCYACNVAKGTKNYNEFKIWIKMVHDNLSKEGI
jgi:hypothetical protein